ncbi:MAG: hypothetical protein DMF84_21660 [Acidobacteria bacterium]|nr:MAG: hypothetical protein DMF84_21660 [Acidobacteriota bacterium]
MLGSVKRAIARSRARKGADHTLRALKARLEQDFKFAGCSAVTGSKRRKTKTGGAEALEGNGFQTRSNGGNGGQ